MLTRSLLLLVAVALLLPGAVRAEDCGSQAGGALCADSNWCCSQWGWCGVGDAYCGDGCQSGPCAGPVPPPPPTISPKPTPAPNTPAPFSLVGCQAVRNTVNFGYYESWAKWRGCNPVAANAIDVATFGYTHLAYSFASISSGGLLEEWSYGDGADYALFNSLKGANPTLKTLIAVGGWTFDQTKFSDVASTAAKRSAFAASVVTFCDTHNFDGIDFDWEYPVTRQGTPADYANYPLLLQAVRQAFDAAGHGTAGGDPWLITVATSINTSRLSQGYNLAAMTPYVDWFNMMSYDIYGAWDSTAGANADMPYITTTMQYIFDLGIPREKLVLGLAAYGRSTRLASPSCVGTQGGYTDGCPVTGGGLTGCHGETGNLPYFEIKESYVDPGNYDSLVLNTNTGSMEMISGGGAYFTSFDNDDTFNIKYQYAYAQCMRGIMWWAVDLIKEPIVFTATLPPTISPKPTDAPTTSSGPTTSPKPTKAPTPPPTSPPTIVPPCGVGCPVGATGNYATVDCAGFHMCNSGAYLATFACAPDTLFDETLGVCNYATAVNCACTAPTPPPTPAPTKFGVPATPPPTSPPTTPLLPSSCTQCDGSQFMVAGLDCLGFHYCNSANLGNYVACPVNTLYNEAIMGCDWDYNVNCQCYGPGGAPVPAPVPAPAPSPVSPPTGPTPIGSPTTYNYGCPTTCTGGELVSAIDCTGFCQCTNGAPSQYVPCGADTLFDYSLQVCVHPSDVTCTYLSGGPLPPPATPTTPTTPATTPPPTPPTAPIPAGSVYYPDWERSATCSNDGRQPNWMGAPYFFPTLKDCCNAWFWWQLGSVSGPCYGPF